MIITPSKKELIEAGFDEITADLLRTVFKEEKSMPNRCLNSINEIIDGWGVERIYDPDSHEIEVRYIDRDHNEEDITIAYYKNVYVLLNLNSLRLQNDRQFE